MAFDTPVPMPEPPPSPGYRPQSPPPVSQSSPPIVSMQINFPAARIGPKVKYSWCGEAWDLFRANAGIWIAATLAQLLPDIIFYGIAISFGLIGGYSLSGNSDAESTGSRVQGSVVLGEVLAFIPVFILNCRLNYATSLMANRQVRGESISYSDIWKNGPGVYKVFWVTLLTNVLAVIAAYPLYVPALIVFAFTLPAMALAADNVDVIESIKQSFGGMKKDWLNAILFSFLFLLLFVISAIPCGLGLLVTCPMYNLIMSLAYRDMVGMTGSSPSSNNPGYEPIAPYPPISPSSSFAAQIPPGTMPSAVPSRQAFGGGIKATKTTIALSAASLVVVFLLVGFWLIHLSHPQASDNNVENGVSVNSIASTDDIGQSSPPAPTVDNTSADSPVQSPSAQDIPVSDAPDNSGESTSATTLDDSPSDASSSTNPDSTAAGITTNSDADTMAAYAPAGSGLDDTPLSIDVLQNNLISAADLKDKSLRALSISHNTIYALHGYVFSRPVMKSYFEAQSWYHPNPGFLPDMLSAVEQSNAQTIRAAERSQFGYGKASFDEQGRPYQARDPLSEIASPGSSLNNQMIDVDTLQHRLITDDDLSDKSLAALSVSYNAIYAVHGYVFKRRSLSQLFGQASWYRPNPAFKETDFSDTEKANLQTIRAYERSHFNF